MSDNVVLALEHLFNVVDTRFKAEELPAENVFATGSSKQVPGSNQRITWIAGDPNGSVGAMLPPRFPGRRPEGRRLAGIREMFHVVIDAVDPSAPQDTMAQYRAVRLLLDDWLRLALTVKVGNWRVESLSYVNAERKVSTYGRAIRVVCSIDAFVPDTAIKAAPADVTGEFDLKKHDHEEEIVAPAIQENGP